MTRHPMMPLALSLSLLAALNAAPHATQPGGRLRPPAAVTCDRNQLTSYTGRVESYRPAPNHTALVIHTDEDTREAIRVAHPGKADGREHYLVDGAPWTSTAWTRVEIAAGTLARGQRATAWVCADGRVVIDWSTTRREP